MDDEFAEDELPQPAAQRAGERALQRSIFDRPLAPATGLQPGLQQQPLGGSQLRPGAISTPAPAPAAALAPTPAAVPPAATPAPAGAASAAAATAGHQSASSGAREDEAADGKKASAVPLGFDAKLLVAASGREQSFEEARAAALMARGGRKAEAAPTAGPEKKARVALAQTAGSITALQPPAAGPMAAAAAAPLSVCAPAGGLAARPTAPSLSGSGARAGVGQGVDASAAGTVHKKQRALQPLGGAGAGAGMGAAALAGVGPGRQGALQPVGGAGAGQGPGVGAGADRQGSLQPLGSDWGSRPEASTSGGAAAPTLAQLGGSSRSSQAGTARRPLAPQPSETCPSGASAHAHARVPAPAAVASTMLAPALAPAALEAPRGLRPRVGTSGAEGAQLLAPAAPASTSCQPGFKAAAAAGGAVVDRTFDPNVTISTKAAFDLLNDLFSDSLDHGGRGAGQAAAGQAATEARPAAKQHAAARPVEQGMAPQRGRQAPIPAQAAAEPGGTRLPSQPMHAVVDAPGNVGSYGTPASHQVPEPTVTISTRAAFEALNDMFCDQLPHEDKLKGGSKVRYSVEPQEC